MNCSDWNRRKLLLAGLGVTPLLLGGCLDLGGGEEESTPAPPPQTNSPPASPRVAIAGSGCYRPQYGGAQPANVGCGVLPNFGDPQLDRQWQEEIQIQAQFFGPVAATVLVLDECSAGAANAFALPEGFILFGRHLAARLIAQTGTTLPIAGVLAHEWGHRAQFSFGWMVQTEPTARRTELEADMWSGLYMGVAKLWTGPILQSFFQALISLGDYNFNHPSHHGTPNQRFAAGATGLNLALQLMQTQTRLSYPEVHALFVNEVTRITATIQTAADQIRLKTKLARAAESLSWAARQIGERMDREWILGIAQGQRRLEELSSLPALSAGERMNLAPY